MNYGKPLPIADMKASFSLQLSEFPNSAWQTVFRQVAEQLDTPLTLEGDQIQVQCPIPRVQLVVDRIKNRLVPQINDLAAQRETSLVDARQVSVGQFARDPRATIDAQVESIRFDT